jgi:hypothetical protein
VDRSENAEELMKQAERRRLRFAVDSGFLVVESAASADQERADTAGMDQELIEPAGQCLRELFSVAMARSRGVRGKYFVGRQVLVPSQKIMGTLEGVDASGIVTVSYRSMPDPERVSNLSYSGPGDDLLIIVADERTDQASPTSFSGVADEKVRRSLEGAALIGLSLDHDSGFTLAKWRAMGDSETEVRDAAIRQLGNSRRDVFAYAVAQARGRRGAAFVGQRVFVPALDAFGILASCDVDGSLSVNYRDKHMESDRTCHCPGDRLLVITVGAEDAARASSAVQDSVPAWRRLVRRAFPG